MDGQGGARAGRRQGPEARGHGVATSWGNDVALLRGAPATYAALERAIEAAERRAWLTMYAFRDDRSGAPIFAALEHAARRGLDVRVAVDAFGSRGSERSLGRLRRSGAHTRIVRAVRRDARRLGRPDARNHKKVAVLDSAVGFVGGVNVGDQFVGWRDLHLRVHGPAAKDLEDVVLDDFEERGRATRSAPDARVPRAGARGRLDVVSSHVPGALHRVVRGLLAEAEERVVLTTPYFVPDRQLVSALTHAARRGVHVEILTPRRSNWPVANWAGRTLFPELLEAGVRVAEHPRAMLHGKALVVDGRVAAVGSPNFDARSFHINGEVLCLVHDRDVARGIERAIEEDGQGACAVELGSFLRRSLRERVVERTAALLSPWL